MNSYDEDTYIIPHNYSDNGKILGIIEKQSLFVAACWFIPITFLNFKVLPMSIDFKIFIEIIIVLPPTLLILAGIGGETLLDFLKYILRFYKNSHKYYYEK